MRLWSWIIIGFLFVTSLSVVPVNAQLPTIDLNQLYPNLLNQNPENQVVAKCVRLDGHCLLELAVPKSDLSKRIETIQNKLYSLLTLLVRIGFLKGLTMRNAWSLR